MVYMLSYCYIVYFCRNAQIMLHIPFFEADNTAKLQEAESGEQT